MEVANAASARRIYEAVVGRVPICFRLPAPSHQPCVHDQTPNISSLLRLWTGIRLACRSLANAAQYFSGHPRRDESSSCKLRCPRFDHALHRNFDSPLVSYLVVSYLAQTRNSGPVIILVLTMGTSRDV
jgi:hypothetical protein